MSHEVEFGALPAARPIFHWTNGVLFEEAARKQVHNVASLPFVQPHVAIMPDVHWGMGATVGSVIPTRGAVIPAAVGVDIGCGMVAQRTPWNASDLPDSLAELRSNIERAVPHGRTNNGGPGDRGAWGETPQHIVRLFVKVMANSLVNLFAKHPGLRVRNDPAKQWGTLGTGNHFIEICLDEEQRVWVMLHSGSRGIGNRIGTYFIEKAKEDMKRWFINLPDQDLAYIPEGSILFEDYMDALMWAQEYARLNRMLMFGAVMDQLRRVLSQEQAVLPCDVEAINCHHNYVSRENHFGENLIITRKGAVRAREGELGIIPGSMGARSYIVRGRGNAESFNSCSHGAGRKMSRNAAKKQFTLDDHKQATEGVECRKDQEVIDETPGAYKDIDAVMEAQSDLVEIVHTLKQVLCVKG